MESPWFEAVDSVQVLGCQPSSITAAGGGVNVLYVYSTPLDTLAARRRTWSNPLPSVPFHRLDQLSGKCGRTSLTSRLYHLRVADAGVPHYERHFGSPQEPSPPGFRNIATTAAIVSPLRHLDGGARLAVDRLQAQAYRLTSRDSMRWDRRPASVEPGRFSQRLAQQVVHDRLKSRRFVPLANTSCTACDLVRSARSGHGSPSRCPSSWPGTRRAYGVAGCGDRSTRVGSRQDLPSWLLPPCDRGRARAAAYRSPHLPSARSGHGWHSRAYPAAEIDRPEWHAGSAALLPPWSGRARPHACADVA